MNIPEMVAAAAREPGWLFAGATQYVCAVTYDRQRAWALSGTWERQLWGFLFAGAGGVDAWRAVDLWLRGNLIAAALFGAAAVGMLVMLWKWWRRRPRRKPSRTAAVVRRIGERLRVVPTPAPTR